ncbi:hypothetical protein ACLB2K_027434 [Fragaria x ananassa]
MLDNNGGNIGRIPSKVISKLHNLEELYIEGFREWGYDEIDMGVLALSQFFDRYCCQLTFGHLSTVDSLLYAIPTLDCPNIPDSSSDFHSSKQEQFRRRNLLPRPSTGGKHVDEFRMARKQGDDSISCDLWLIEVWTMWLFGLDGGIIKDVVVRIRQEGLDSSSSASRMGSCGSETHNGVPRVIHCLLHVMLPISFDSC